MSTVIRRARPAEAVALTEIASAAKRHWGYPEEWISRWRDSLAVTPAYIQEREVFVALEGGRPSGFYAVVAEGEAVVLDHLWVAPDRIGRGLGRALFGHAVETARAHGAARLQIDSDPHAEGFYRRMGALRVGETPADMDGVRRVLPRMEFLLSPPQPPAGAGGSSV